MDISGNTVLVTGGGTGIGLSIAAGFLKTGSRVIICGRNLDALVAAQEANPGLEIVYGDVAAQGSREELAEVVLSRFSSVNILVNNAGIQRRVDFLTDDAPWQDRVEEIAINFEAPVHLAALFLPHLLKQKRAAIVNVTSGLAFIPSRQVAVYSATKAAMHSFTLSLRSQLEGSSVSVVEVIPPAVNTDLGGTGLHTSGVPVSEFTDAVLSRLAAGDTEIGYGTSETFRTASREEARRIFDSMNRADP
ncbi:SDR family oxidoreductase [Pseudomonas aeruginosa]|uniref:SDR family oxidoreductase n=1 Tax=Pseudomonas aeruginosa TaxID=287 RepID=UPI000B9FFC89|nr:SDR family NAD(P)-dependent oxidoreductase [Pseudomonas aeruginosa]EIU1321634.1 SDR family oxidoreductase [Pseudomonas aeruginosa]ELY3880530.1 SDR family oxidoreductase [Pseudomonas aeruginosa]MCO2110214.1 SDR family NAD(P)-dependent oxidoreductase [Pseudomonas aeruginosa]MDV8060225.1 SDR family NAD(P)-dependent oxidoreductase [Pseudomonas aeruginosa]MDV8088002.1 SDR family NAD(P)-dependent oxidoreductase [Pseudomonas aeruginosa]